MDDELLGNLRHLLELDRGLGLEWMGRGGLTSSATSTRPEVVAVPVARAAEPVATYAALTPASAPTPTPSVPVAQAPQPTPAVSEPIAQIASEIAACRACGLCSTRTNTVPGAGSITAELVFVGEGPGADEDASGEPFVGKAGELLTKMIGAMGLSRDQVFICNVVKCRPPANRTPAPDEVAACMGYLHRQLAAIRPKVICTLGNTPLRALMNDDSLGITRLRGTRLDYRGTPLIPTFHPAFLLRNDTAKKPCWEDLKQVLAVLGRTPPARS